MPAPTDAKPLTQNLLTHLLDGDSRLYGESETGTDQGYFTVSELKSFLDTHYAVRVGNLTPGIADLTLSASGTVTGASLTQTLAEVSLSGSGVVTGTPPAVVFLGNGLASNALSNRRLSGEGSGANVYETAQGFVARGVRIDSLITYRIYLEVPGSYNLGNGGKIVHEIRTNNPTTNMPTDTVLATTPELIGDTRWWDKTTAQSTYPGAVWSTHSETAGRLWYFRVDDLTSSLTTTPGDKLWIVSRQTNSDRGTHAISMDMARNISQTLWATENPAFDASMEWQVRKRLTSGSGWVTDSGGGNQLYALFSVLGDVDFGQTMYQVGYPAGESDSGYNVNGTKKVRQVWDASLNYTLTELHIGACIRPGGAAPLACAIKRNGSLVHTAYFSGYPAAGTEGSEAEIYDHADFQSALLPNLAISAGDQVIFELSTTAGTDYEIPFMQEGTKAGYFVGGTPEWHAEYANDGVTWSSSSTVYEIPIGVLAVPG